MNKVIFIFLFILGCQYPEPMNPDPIFDDVPDASDVRDTTDTSGSELQDVSVPEDVIEAKPIETPVIPIPPKHQNILLIGDSQVRYVNWQIKSVQRPNETVFADSVGGTTIGWWNYDAFHREMSKYWNLDLVVIFLGTNNFNFPYLQPYQNILNEIQARKVKCIWVGPTNVRMRGFKNLHIVGGLIKNAVAGTCTYIDTEALDIPLEDGIHPTPQGAIKWLTEVWRVKDSF